MRCVCVCVYLCVCLWLCVALTTRACDGDSRGGVSLFVFVHCVVVMVDVVVAMCATVFVWVGGRRGCGCLLSTGV